MRSPGVSVVLAVYNGRGFLAETLRSVLAQTWEEFEIIAVDDGSTDGSAGILEACADPRLRILRQANQGQSAAVSAGIAAARGAWIAFVDQDDLWERGHLRRAAETFTAHPETDLTFCWFTVIDQTNGEIGVRSARVKGTLSFAELLTDFVIGGTSNVVVRKAALEEAGGADPAIPRLFDLDLFLRVALLRPGNVRAIPEELMRYRRHGAQVSRGIAELEREWNLTLGKLRARAPQRVAPVEDHARSNMYRYFARLSYEADEHGRGLAYLAKGFAAAPARFAIDGRNWLTLAACGAGMLLPRQLLRAAERGAGLRRNE